MTRLLSTTVLALIVSGSLAAQQPDFSGSWKLNPAMSDTTPMGAPPRGDAPGGGRPGMGGGRGMMMATEVFITQLTSRMTIEQKFGERARTSTYSLDGSESRNVGMAGADFVTTSGWEGSTIVTKGRNSFKTPMGDMTIESNEVRSISEDGKQMTVETTIVSPRGTNKRKLVYDKL